MRPVSIGLRQSYIIAVVQVFFNILLNMLIQYPNVIEFFKNTKKHMIDFEVRN